MEKIETLEIDTGKNYFLKGEVKYFRFTYSQIPFVTELQFEVDVIIYIV